MLIYTDLLTGEPVGLDQQCCTAYCNCNAPADFVDVAVGDEMIADSYDMKEVEDGFFFEVEGSVRT